MAGQRSGSAPGPGMYCRKCFYALGGLDTNRCPECGREFDPADRRTYRRRQPRLTPPQRRSIVLAAVLVIYFGGYYYMVAVSPRWAPDRLNHAYERFEPDYRFAQPSMRILFTPAYRLDAVLRHDRWHKFGWEPTNWGYREEWVDEEARCETLGATARFVVDQVESLRVWKRRANMIDPTQRPIMTVRYRARNVDTTSHWYLIWLNDGTNPVHRGVKPISLWQVIADGEVQELSVDLFELLPDLYEPAGDIRQVAVGVLSTKAGGAFIELHELRFDPRPAAAAEKPAATNSDG